MVGVAGKYKGCETCRRRRVTCHNERPYCSNCINSGRKCEGYEKQRVFITGTPDDKGRVASHPRKSTSSRASSSGSRRTRRPLEGSSTPEITPERVLHQGPSQQSWNSSSVTPQRPLSSAWDDYIALQDNGTQRYALVTTLQQSMRVVDVQDTFGTRADDFSLPMLTYTPGNVYASPSSSSQTSGRCLAHLSERGDSQPPAEDYCIWLYEVQSPGFETDQSHGFDTVQILGPDLFASFPHHHFFVRAFRPMKIGAALLNRQSTFLANSEWTANPWRNHPKSLFDQLLDQIAFLPYLLERTDMIAPMPGTTERRDEAQNLLQNGLALETRLHHWLRTVNQGSSAQSTPYWTREAADSGELPFYYSYAFKDAPTGMMFLYYWMCLIPLHRCIENLYNIMYEPVLNEYPDMWTSLPLDLRVEDLPKYQQTLDLAAEVCRGLDSVLDNTVQPDILIAPMTMALDLYREMGAVARDCTLEILWLEAFRDRLIEKGSYVVSVVREQTWREIGRF